ncbi:VOC family protein [uncultured Roseibium sp.]|uniref:VOC family protein n=1 Tax=uncultured Roseibium sp. TaxID=1936171 RepID=UPI00262FBDFF|nr:VOC family protein [uncultured Roseibium sp.]
MLKLDHLTVIAPTLAEGVAHVRDCLDLDVPFGTRHEYMGTHNHRLQLGDRVYLEIIAVDPDGRQPHRSRWFGLDDNENVRKNWDEGRRLRGWVASTKEIGAVLSQYGRLFGDEVALPFIEPEFAFSIPQDGALPHEGALPSLIDHRDDPTSMAEIPDMGARLLSFSVRHPDPGNLEMLYEMLNIVSSPTVQIGKHVKYRAEIETPDGMKILF